MKINNLTRGRSGSSSLCHVRKDGGGMIDQRNGVYLMMQTPADSEAGPRNLLLRILRAGSHF